MINILLAVPFLVMFILGTVLGSFLNVLIYRLPREISFTKGFSKCPHCEHRLVWKDLVPLFSWIVLKGKCRYCKEPIGWRYPLVEFINGMMYVGVFAKFGFSAQTIIYCVITSCLLGVAFTDWEHMIIPDTYSVVMGAMGVALLALEQQMRVERLIGAIAVSSAFFLIVAVSKGRAMGGGDVKLMASLGLCIGWQQILFVTVLGALLGTLALIALKNTRYAMGRQVPFGTFLSIAGIASVFFGGAFLAWYLPLLNPHAYHD